MKKILCAILAAAMLVCGALVLSSCGNANELVMATNPTFPPYEMKENGEVVGIDAEIAAAIAEKLGMTLKIESVKFDTIIGGVQTGKYDIGMAGITVTEKRKESVNFTQTYATGVQVVIVPEDSPFATIDDFFNCDEEGNWLSVKAGVKIGVQQGTTGDIYASDTVENFGFGSENVTKYDNGPDAVAALLAGRVSAVIIDNEPAKNYVKSNAGLKILDTEYTNEDYAICVSKNNTELLDKINKALDELKADGTIDAIIHKYIPSEN